VGLIPDDRPHAPRLAGTPDHLHINMSGCWPSPGSPGTLATEPGGTWLARARWLPTVAGCSAGIRHIAGSDLSLCETRSELSLWENLGQVVIGSANRDEEVWAGRARHRRRPRC